MGLLGLDQCTRGCCHVLARPHVRLCVDAALHPPGLLLSWSEGQLRTASSRMVLVMKRTPLLAMLVVQDHRVQAWHDAIRRYSCGADCMAYIPIAAPNHIRRYQGYRHLYKRMCPLLGRGSKGVRSASWLRATAHRCACWARLEGLGPLLLKHWVEGSEHLLISLQLSVVRSAVHNKGSCFG